SSAVLLVADLVHPLDIFALGPASGAKAPQAPTLHPRPSSAHAGPGALHFSLCVAAGQGGPDGDATLGAWWRRGDAVRPLAGIQYLRRQRCENTLHPRPCPSLIQLVDWRDGRQYANMSVPH